MCTNCHYIATSQMLFLIDKLSKDSVFIMGRYLCKYIHNVSHNSLIHMSHDWYNKQ